MRRAVDRLVAATPREFWLDFAGTADAAFAEAERLASRYIEDPERSNMLGQLRHARLEAGWRHDATRHGLTVVAPHTSPKGGRFTLASSENIYILRSNVQTHRGLPRATKFRKQFAELNAWLRPVQTDMFRLVPPPPEGKLCAMLIVTALRDAKARHPAWVGVGFPNKNLDGWADVISVSDMLAMYHDADVPSVEAEAIIEIKDKAVPKLKGRAKE